MRARRLRAVFAASLLAGAIGCAARDDFRLIHPPAAQDEHFPGGHRLLTRAPLGDWQVAAEFSSKAECDRARRDALENALTRAHALVGDDAKNDLGVRRAVNARCVQRVRLEQTPGS